MWQKSTTHTYKQNHTRFPFCRKLPDLISYLGLSVSYANDSAHNQMVNCVAHLIWPVYICLLACFRVYYILGVCFSLFLVFLFSFSFVFCCLYFRIYSLGPQMDTFSLLHARALCKR